MQDPQIPTAAGPGTQPPQTLAGGVQLLALMECRRVGWEAHCGTDPTDS